MIMMIINDNNDNINCSDFRCNDNKEISYGDNNKNNYSNNNYNNYANDNDNNNDKNIDNNRATIISFLGLQIRRICFRISKIEIIEKSTNPIRFDSDAKRMEIFVR